MSGRLEGGEQEWMPAARALDSVIVAQSSLLAGLGSRGGFSKPEEMPPGGEGKSRTNCESRTEMAGAASVHADSNAPWNRKARLNRPLVPPWGECPATVPPR